MAETTPSKPRYRDTRTGRRGELDGYDGRHYVLRPLDGGPPWICPVESARQVSEQTGDEGTRMEIR